MVLPATCAPGIAAGMAALQMFYNPATGLWNTTNWWNAANSLEVTTEYSRITDSLTYRSNIFNTFYQKPRYANFINPWFRDDDGWWALAWIKAYDLTGQTKYLDQAKYIVQNMETGWESKVCGGGLYWHKRELNYKNAITNSLFLSAAAKLHLRDPKDPRYLQWAQRSWQWFKQSGMINADNLVNDGLDSNCKNNGKTTWTYNQGVLIGGLVDLYRATQDQAILDQASAIADTSIVKLAPNGILQEECERNQDCGNDGPQFKGIFMRNLSALYQVQPKPSYREFIFKNANSIWENRNAANQFGLGWATPLDQADAARQTSAMDALNAAIAVGTHGSYPPAVSNSEFTQFNVTVACSGKYSIALRYQSTQDAARYIYINGRSVVNRQIFPATSDWQSVKVAPVWLNAGDNQISVIFNSAKGSQNELMLDSLEFDLDRTYSFVDAR